MPKCPVHLLKKSKIIWLANHLCKHGHSYLEHYSCYLSEKPEENRVGFLDIETSNLDADFGIMLAYCVKIEGENKILGRHLTEEETLNKKQPDKQLVKELIHDMSQFNLLYTYYGCVTPNHKTLNDKLEWVEIGSLKQGDRLIAFSENRLDQNGRKWEMSTVEYAIPMDKECVEVHFSNGQIITCTTDHPFLAGYPEYRWIQAKDMNQFTRGEKSNTKIRKLITTWETDNSTSAAYLAGFYDGEGSIRKNNYLEVCCSQKQGITLDYVTKLLGDKQYNLSVCKQHDDIKQIHITGGLSERLRFLGSIRPKRLLNDINFDTLEKCYVKSAIDPIYVTEIIPVGIKTVIGLQTSSKTYLVDGIGSHNTGFDLKFIRTRAVANGLPFPVFGSISHKDVYYIIKNKFKLHRSGLETACNELIGRTLKTHFDGNTWRHAVQGNQTALGYIFDHCQRDVKDLETLTHKVMDFANPNTTKSI
jgi:uncharacterized protein YprB with RNaseH-like and TPR domain